MLLGVLTVRSKLRVYAWDPPPVLVFLSCTKAGALQTNRHFVFIFLPSFI